MLVLIVDDEIKTPMKKYNEEVTIGDDLEFQKLTVITNKNFKLCSMFVCIYVIYFLGVTDFKKKRIKGTKFQLSFSFFSGVLIFGVVILQKTM